MAAEPPSPPPHGPAIAVTATDGRRAELALAADFGPGDLRELEQRLSAPALNEAREWIVDMSEVTRFDLACAYALLRASTRRLETASLTIHGARRAIQRTLRDVGLDAIAVIDE
ncbi:hypothetical protein SSP35_41_00100 [Streptomyces sp. NBRC 110611]|uniref:STAS domain-containing protein n=1 Tax=Streptomyces sp. NBRC 110611 TaxID=1621259 RepID=UPI0008589EA4|nr:STAS domain-containing protein [Streptomyces sp. NBRC 110611]GAU71466.1 hypothetical protein SSP35_41_00100 [Streptomyces sp. NBRC 110611]